MNKIQILMSILVFGYTKHNYRCIKNVFGEENHIILSLTDSAP